MTTEQNKINNKNKDPQSLEVRDRAKLSRAAYGKTKEDVEKNTPQGWEVVGSEPVGYGKATAWLFKNTKTGKYVLVFPGTQLLNIDTHKANIVQAVGAVGQAYRDAIRLVTITMRKYDLGHDDLELVGHSLGGGLASVAAIANNLAATVFNPAGLHKDTIREALIFNWNNWDRWKKHQATDFQDQINVFIIGRDAVSAAQNKGLTGFLLPNTFGTIIVVPGATGYDKWADKHKPADWPILRIPGLLLIGLEDHSIDEIIKVLEQDPKPR